MYIYRYVYTCAKYWLCTAQHPPALTIHQAAAVDLSSVKLQPCCLIQLQAPSGLLRQDVAETAGCLSGPSLLLSRRSPFSGIRSRTCLQVHVDMDRERERVDIGRERKGCLRCVTHVYLKFPEMLLSRFACVFHKAFICPHASAHLRVDTSATTVQGSDLHVHACAPVYL